MTNRLATNQTQAVVWRWEGEAFGNTVAEKLVGFSINLRFPGQYFDAETNLHYNHFRYYDPTLGRYITSDPIGLLGGLNTYNYVNSNSLSFVDPEGKFIFVPMLIGAGIGAITDIGIQLIMNGGNPQCIDLGQVATSAALGAVGGGIGGYLNKLRNVRQAYQNGLSAARRYNLNPQQAHAARREIGRGLKEETPIGARQWIYGRNLRKYGDELGPKFDPIKHADPTKTLTDTNAILDTLTKLPPRGMPSAGGVVGGGVGAGLSGGGDCECQ